MHFYWKTILLLLLELTSLSCNDVGEDAIYVLPENYQGVVFILFNQRDGEKPEYDNGKRVYIIPENGILKTQFTSNTGWHSFNKYYFNADDNRIEIPFEWESKSIKGDTIKVCCFSSGTAGKDPNDTTREVKFSMFYVGTEKLLDSIYEKGEKINPVDLINQ